MHAHPSEAMPPVPLKQRDNTKLIWKITRRMIITINAVSYTAIRA